MYTVTTHHHCKAWRNGDLEDEFKLEASENFKTRKAAKEYIENKLRGKSDVFRNYHKVDTTSYCGYYTGVTWQHENTGEEMAEYYQFTLKKAKVN